MAATGCHYDWPHRLPDDWILPFQNVRLRADFRVSGWVPDDSPKRIAWPASVQPKYSDFRDQAAIITTTFRRENGEPEGTVWFSWFEPLGPIRCESATRSRTINQLLIASGAHKPRYANKCSQPYDTFLDCYGFTRSISPQIIVSACSGFARIASPSERDKTNGCQRLCLETAEGPQVELCCIEGFDVRCSEFRKVMFLDQLRPSHQEFRSSLRLRQTFRDALAAVGIRRISLFRQQS